MKKLRASVFVLLSILFCLIFAPVPVSPYAFAEQYVYVGGYPIGISLDIGGLLVESVSGVETEYGTAYVDGLERGDIILSINGTEVRTVDDVYGNLTSAETTLELMRGGERFTVTVDPVIEAYTLKPRLGVKIKEKIYGVGTVTFIREDGTYTALGHEMYDSDTGIHLNDCSGAVYGCKMLGVKQGKKGEAGAILASIVKDREYGTVTVNNDFGVAGRMTSDGAPRGEALPVADRSDVHPGDAKIRTTVDRSPEYYDIEIIKASERSGKHEKSLVFRVTDQRLLAASGGIVRGMSGSPIVQDGKLVGAVTHVFLNDFTKGYGIYADCLN